MNNIFEKVGLFFRGIIDFFYPPFKKYMTVEFFRYGATGCMNLVFDWTLYFVVYNFVLQHRMVHLGFISISSHIATLCIKAPIVVVTGFLMQKHITFSHSEIRGRIQLFRYFILFILNFGICYTGLKILVDYCHWYPSLSNMSLSIITIFISYFSQKHFIFKAPKNHNLS